MMTLLWPEGEPVTVQGDELGTPHSFSWRGGTHRVQGIAKRWRVDYGWWRRRIWREYFKLHTDTGLLVILYHDLLGRKWYLQRLYD
jgi:hypothetical protein